jgi:acetate kinase
MQILVVNAGSASLKLRLLGAGDELLASGDIEPWAGSAEDPALTAFVEGAEGVEAVGHRVVHGGSELGGPTLVDDDVEARIQSLAHLAPLHQPGALAAMRAVRTLLPDTPAVACFDTAFHSTLPAAAATYALPQAWTERWGLRRYGFHGLAHAYAVGRASEMLGVSTVGLRVVSCHLGSGASLCAARDGRSVDTTMGFTPLEGLVMATRSGSVDPGLVLWLIEQGGLPAAAVSRALEHDSGLAGLSGTSGDMRQVVTRADSGDGAAELALAVYVHRLRREIAAMAAAMDGIDVLVFTGGVGEHQPALRAVVTEGLGFLGVAVDERRTAHRRPTPT